MGIRGERPGRVRDQRLEEIGIDRIAVHHESVPAVGGGNDIGAVLPDCLTQLPYVIANSIRRVTGKVRSPDALSYGIN